MYIRSVKVPSSSGAVHEYVRIVASVRERGKIKQKVIANLGRRDTLEAVLPLLNRFLTAHDDQQELAAQLAEQGPVELVDASTWGPMLVARHFFAQLGLWQLLDAGRRWPRLLPEENPADDWVSRVLVLITNRLTRPASEHGLAAWLESDYACDRLGRRYVPCWKRQGRVQVDLSQLQRWYRTLDHLILNKDQVEVALYGRLRTLFDFEADLVLYDITSTYFEGAGPAGLAKHGYSRDGKPRNVQVVVGVVMVAGWPRPTFGRCPPSRVGGQHPRQHNRQGGHRGSLQALSLSPCGVRGRSRHGDQEESGHADHKRRPRLSGRHDAPAESRSGDAHRPHRRSEVDRLRGGHQCPREDDSPADTCTRSHVRSSGRPGVRGRQRRAAGLRRTSADQGHGAGSRGAREGAGPRGQGTAQEAGEDRRGGRTRPAKESWVSLLHVGTEGRTLGDLRASSEPGPREEVRRQVFDSDGSDGDDAARCRGTLQGAQRGGAGIPFPQGPTAGTEAGCFGRRPIWHWASRRVKAHIFVAALAFLFERMLERALADAGVSLSARAALEALTTVRHVQFRVDGDLRSGVTPGSARARQVLKALQLTDHRPPQPPPGDETTM